MQFKIKKQKHPNLKLPHTAEITLRYPIKTVVIKSTVGSRVPILSHIFRANSGGRLQKISCPWLPGKILYPLLHIQSDQLYIAVCQQFPLKYYLCIVAYTVRHTVTLSTRITQPCLSGRVVSAGSGSTILKGKDTEHLNYQKHFEYTIFNPFFV